MITMSALKIITVQSMRQERNNYLYKVDINNSSQIAKLTSWCTKNLKDEEYNITPLRLLPPVYRFRFKCEKEWVWAVINS